MSISDCTKGNWKYTISKNGRHQVSGEDGRQVAMLWNNPSTNSNGNVLAASKDLYWALKLAKDMMVANGLSLPSTFEVIDNALNKADGVDNYTTKKEDR